MTSFEIFRTSLIITLLVLLAVILWKRLRRWMLTRDVPVPRHAELLDLMVEYHPSRIRLEVKVPQPQMLHLALMNDHHETLMERPGEQLAPGTHVLMWPLDGRADGTYHLEVRTATQRTVRRFRLMQA